LDLFIFSFFENDIEVLQEVVSNETTPYNSDVKQSAHLRKGEKDEGSDDSPRDAKPVSFVIVGSTQRCYHVRPDEFDPNLEAKCLTHSGWTPLWYYAMAPSLSRQCFFTFQKTCETRKYNGFSSYDWCSCQPGRLQDFVVHANGVQSDAAHLQ